MSSPARAETAIHAVRDRHIARLRELRSRLRNTVNRTAVLRLIDRTNNIKAFFQNTCLKYICV